MKLIHVGTSCGYPRKNRFWSCEFLLVQNNIYIIDAGAPISDLIARYDLEYKNVCAVIVTHPHVDHLGYLPPFVNLMNGYYKYGSVRFLLPSQPCIDYARFVADHIEQKPLDPRLSFEVYHEGIIYQDPFVTFTAVKNGHCANSYSLFVETEGKKVLLSGDLTKTYADLPACAFDNSLDYLLLECAHQFPPTVKEVFPKLRAKRVGLNHIGRATPEGILRDVLSTCPIPITITSDGDLLEI